MTSVSAARKERIPELGETVHVRELASGTAVLVLPKPGFTKKYATVTVHYGSLDNHFRTPEGEERRVPEGVAHFLEHKMFAKPDGDVFDRFAALGVGSNAYTGFATTTYLISTSQNFEAAFDLLIDFVQEPYFTPEGVEKERGIIAEELRMYRDSPHWRLFQGLKECLYHRHPVRDDIGGTLESLAEIDAEVLALCHRTFYHPSNMAVTAVGDLDPDEIAQRVAQSLARHGNLERKGPIARIPPEEPADPAGPRATARMAVARPLLCIGYKDAAPPATGRELVRRELLTSIGLEVALGKASPLYNRLYESGLIGRSFGASAFIEETFGFVYVSAETDEPERLERELREGLGRFVAEGVAPADVERVRRRLFGDLAGEFDAPESLAHALAESHFIGVGLSDHFELLRQVRAEDVHRRMRECLRDDRAAVSVVLPAR
ncbi:MAG: insulinase family protein [Clostridia bacterium]|nr:insulinase family protein [Clostridia bacterium]